MADLQTKLKESTEFEKLQKDIDIAVIALQKLESQLQENKNVQNEFSTLPKMTTVYKLIGPVLIKQDRNEAAMNVNKRLEFIKSEIKRIEEQLKELQEKSGKKKIEIFRIQTVMQQTLQGTQGHAVTAH